MFWSTFKTTRASSCCSIPVSSEVICAPPNGLSKDHLIAVFSSVKHEVLHFMLSFYWDLLPPKKFSLYLHWYVNFFLHIHLHTHLARTSNILQLGKKYFFKPLCLPPLQYPKEKGHFSLRDIVLAQSYLEQFTFQSKIFTL